MNEHERLEDPAFARLVAADPARRAPDPAQGVLRAKVDALIAEQAGQRPAGGAEHGAVRREATGHERSDELALRRHRRRTPWLVAAAVAGIVAAGGGGYVAGESGLGSPPASDTVGSADQAPSVMSERDEGGEEGGEESGAAPEGLQPLIAGGDLPAATGYVFHAGAALSEVPRTAEVRVAGTHGESLGSYPVVSEVEAVERLGDPRFAGAVLGRPSPPREETGPTATPVPGGPLAWPVEDVTIVAATLTEVRYALPDGTVLFVPAYDLADAEGGSWTVMAVDDDKLDFAL
ncbi:hypothetical protein [Promicromonospora iranensis]|uniref:Uncharacterized protein n=1 Tax=Promicromonospora iranensis TaxID=1105144 RepID=A0ABU2CQU1_9MICO|nr:hypothetical protein [Promicromonospora iranensis]MDR7383708.1 hypothetical protein [Promicromonospora iranensis]